MEATDNGSGILAYNLYARTSDTETWSVVLGNQTESHIEFALPEAVEGLQFMVRAIDCAGNHQLSDGNMSAIDQINGQEGETITHDDEQLYDLRGVKHDSGIKPDTPAVLISTKGRKVLIQ